LNGLNRLYCSNGSKVQEVQALYWDGKTLRLKRDYPTPKASDQVALVRVRLAGIKAA